MTIDEYAQWVASVSKPGQSRYERLSYSALALIGEAGEVCDNIKNLIRDGTLNEDCLGLRTWRPDLFLDLPVRRVGQSTGRFAR